MFARRMRWLKIAVALSEPLTGQPSIFVAKACPFSLKK
jgi:hypothetical protein